MKYTEYQPARELRTRAVVWRRLDTPGHDAAFLHVADGGGWRVDGTAVFLHDGQACCLRYAVDTNRRWHTVLSHVSGWLGGRRIDLAITVDDKQHWTMNGTPVPGVAGCIDVDLAFTPATNILPVRRLSAAVGESCDVAAAWLTFPDFTLERLEQTYRRRDKLEYDYESLGGSFRTALRFLATGFVGDYPGLWRAEQ